MAATLLPSGWYVEPDVIDERTGLPMLTSTQIDGINQRIASGFNQYAIGTRILRTDDGAVLTLTGIGATAAFVPAGAGDVPPASFEGLLGDPTDNVQLAMQFTAFNAAIDAQLGTVALTLATAATASLNAFSYANAG